MTDTIPTQTMDNDAVVRRLYACGKWKLESVAHFGGDETDIADMCLLRDDGDKPFIPAASIAGTARSFLARQSEPWGEYKKGKENREVKRLFGGAEKDDAMSALIVADAACVPEQVTTLIRDGVRVDAQSGSAAAGAKFDVEVVERGTEFELNLECIIRHGDDSDALAELFLALLQAFQRGDIRLGARTRRGYGRGKVESWKVRDLQMNNPEDVMAWLRRDIWSCSKAPLVLRRLQPEESIFLVLPAHRSECTLSPPSLQLDQRQYFQIEANFALHTSLLIRSSPAEIDAPDMVHLQSVGKPVVPGTSFAGAFRHRAALIAETLGWQPWKTIDYEDADPVCEMFGPVHEQDCDDGQQKELWASRIWIEEKLVENVESRWQHRVAIDRFTGGSLQSALFNEKPLYPIQIGKQNEEKQASNLRLTLTLEEPDDAEIGLLLLTLRDFWHGHAVLGGETSNGRGTLQGLRATLRLKRPSCASAGVWELKDEGNRMKIVEDNAEFLNNCVEQAKCYSNNPDGSRRPPEEG